MELGAATLYTSTAAFTSSTKPQSSLWDRVKRWNENNNERLMYGIRLHRYMQSLPTEEELMQELSANRSSTPSQVIDHKANYSWCANSTINLGRYLDLLRDDVATHARHGKQIKSVTEYMRTHYAALVPLLEEVLFDDYARVQWEPVKHLEAIGFIVYWERQTNVLVVRWDQHEIVV